MRSDNLTDTISLSNLGNSLLESQNRIESQSELLDDIRLKFPEKCSSLLPPDIFNLESLLWARGHYLSRRYPGKYSLPADNDDNSASEHHLGQEKGLQSLGCLVPLLDMLNHNHDHDWLRFHVEKDFLHVICNYPVQKVFCYCSIGTQHCITIELGTNLSANCSGF